jgi:hypothetical protein
VLLINGGTNVAQIQNGTLTGGTWKASPGATLSLPENITIIGENARVEGSTPSMPWLEDLSLIEGFLRLRASSTIVDHLSILGGGGTQIDAPAQVNAPGGVDVGGEESIHDEITEVPVIADVDEARLITPTLRIYGALVPGGHGEPGYFNLTGDLQMQPTGRVDCELGGLQPVGEHDTVGITGAASLGGVLQLSLVDQFVPVAGQQFTVLTASGGIAGAFASILPPPGGPAGLAYEALYTPTSVTLRVVGGCYPNCDGSTVAPILNVLDFNCFLNGFAAGNTYANCDGSTVAPVLNVLDFNCFLNRFSAGCSAP